LYPSVLHSPLVCGHPFRKVLIDRDLRRRKSSRTRGRRRSSRRQVAADRTRGSREEIAGLRLITSYFAGAGGARAGAGAV
jgi:hypothetical protein